MKIVTLSIFLLFVAFESNAQNYFNKIYGENYHAEAGFAITTDNNNYFITGVATPGHDSLIPRSGLTICLNQNGDTIWTRKDSVNNPWCLGMVKLNNSIFEIGNADFYTAPNRQELYLQKLRLNGDTVWTKYLRFREYDFGEYLIGTHDSGLVIVGSLSTDSNVYDYNDTTDRCYIIKMDSNGNIQWIDSSLVNIEGNFSNKGIENKDHSFTIAGWYGDSALVLKLDSNGHQLWYNYYPSIVANGEATFGCVIQTSDNGFLAGGYTGLGFMQANDPFSEYYGNFVMKIDSNGNMQWQKTYGDDTIYGLGFRQIRRTLDGNYILIGSSEHYNIDTIYAAMVKIDSVGSELFERKFYRTPFPAGQWDGLTYDILATPDSGFIFVGSNFDTTQRVWVVKTDKYGCDSVGCQLATGIVQIEQQNSSFSIYPNPALTQTTVLYSVPENTQQVNLLVYDITGQLVEQIPLNKYTNQTTLDIGDLPSGMYLVELKTDEGVVVRKFVKE